MISRSRVLVAFCGPCRTFVLLGGLFMLCLLGRVPRSDAGSGRTPGSDVRGDGSLFEPLSAGMFCAAPYLAVCAPTEADRVAADARKERIRRDVTLLELAAALRDSKAGSATELHILRTRSEVRGLRRVLLRAAQLEEGRIAPELELVRARLIEVIGSEPGLRREQREDYISRIRAVEWLGSRRFVDFLDRLPELNQREKKLAYSFASVCAGGLESNAFVFGGRSRLAWNPREWGWEVMPRYSLILCPGKLLELDLASSQSTRRIRALLARLVGHELGHAIDALDFPDDYESYLSCLSNHASALELREIQDDSSEEVPWSGRSRVDSHAGEIVADKWGMKVLARMLERGELGGTPRDRLDSVQAALSRLCTGDAGDEGIHPSGRYRIEILAGTDPGLRQALGCSLKSVSDEGSCRF